MWISLKDAEDPGEKFSYAPMDVHHLPALAKLMNASYQSSVDYDGETLESCTTEVHQTLQGKYGPVIPSASLVHFEGHLAVSAMFVTLWSGRPLLVHCVTDPSHQGQGRSAFLLRKALYQLKLNGYQDLCLMVAEQNQPAEKLYLKLGFKRIGPVVGSGAATLPPVIPTQPT